MHKKGLAEAVTPRLKRREFEKIRELAHEKFGLDLKPGKEELVLSRLGKKLREGGFPSFDDYYRHVIHDRTGESLIALIDALTTNYTSFFREPDHFEFLQNRILPGLRKRQEVRIWCAAAATGEEPYSLAITVFEALGGGAAGKLRILATDISTRALTTGGRGIYPEEQFPSVPQAVRRRYLMRGQGPAQGYYRVRPEVRKCIDFRRLNLVEKFWFPVRFPVIFCRNVMIYFDQQTRREVVSRMLEFLEPGGYLIVGHSESLAGREFALDYVQPAVYRKRAPSKWRTGGGGGRL